MSCIHKMNNFNVNAFSIELISFIDFSLFTRNILRRCITFILHKCTKNHIKNQRNKLREINSNFKVYFNFKKKVVCFSLQEKLTSSLWIFSANLAFCFVNEWFLIAVNDATLWFILFLKRENVFLWKCKEFGVFIDADNKVEMEKC